MKQRSRLKRAFLVLTCCFGLSQQASFAQDNQKFQNPILAGFYPDPAICRVGEDYYLILSTFAYFPGVPIFHSKDLVNWNQIGNILDRPEQLNLEKHRITRGIFAPTISYHDGVYYMVTTLIDRGGNFVVTAKNPAGPWSNPAWLPDVQGIDPSLFFDDDGKAYIIYNGDAPDNKPLYDGHRTIRMQEFDYKNLKTTSAPIILVNGGVDFSKKPVWIEGPHIYKKDGYYYLMAAEGGTSVNHSEVILRSKKVNGDYVPNPNNPILTQRHLPANRKNPVSATGHADLVQTQNGEWWAVFLATRPYDTEDHYNIGRETFLAPVEWKDGWPIINPGHEEVQYAYQRPKLPFGKAPKLPVNGNFTYREDFKESKLPLYWLTLRAPGTQWYSLSKPAGSLTLDVRPETVSGTDNPSFIARRQQHIYGNASTKMEFKPASSEEFAGLVALQSEKHYYALGKTIANGKEVVQLRKSQDTTKPGTPETTVLAEAPLNPKDPKKPLFLKVDFKAGKYAFYYGTKEGEWTLLQDNVDGTFLSTRTAGGFVGVTLGMYATSQGKPSTGKATFDWFHYEGKDPIYDTSASVKAK
ncbi:glycoside hydrolase family 43 protein [Rufibacter latericius]|uniref:Glycoside hydrolase family 43 protein n=1 Tax=Rufibacter latericius TaxID=2487040 RepID=A0A3M9MUE3_9BACT|nr:glycoside hydrolase family 43 protein [Rufibacter latericius]RNI29151.1 glycoside hydrolase family 43 protein [Rufibacter latericius]